MCSYFYPPSLPTRPPVIKLGGGGGYSSYLVCLSNYVFKIFFLLFFPFFFLDWSSLQDSSDIHKIWLVPYLGAIWTWPDFVWLCIIRSWIVLQKHWIATLKVKIKGDGGGDGGGGGGVCNIGIEPCFASIDLLCVCNVFWDAFSWHFVNWFSTFIFERCMISDVCTILVYL